MANDVTLARALGAFSIGLGAVQIAAPRRFAEAIGVSGERDRTALVRALGAREIGAGAGLLTRPRPVAWLLARVSGDAMDLALLGAASRSDGARRGRLAAVSAAVVGITALDLLAAASIGRRGGGTRAEGGSGDVIVIDKAITINRPPEEVYRFWRDFENLPRFMANLESVHVIGDTRSRWKAKAPLGKSVEWEAEIVDDRPNESIAWRSLPGADVSNWGRVWFVPAPQGRGTEVRVEMEYRPPAGALGATLAKLGREEPTEQVQGDLRRFKQVLETGDVVRSESTSHDGGIKQRPAQPPSSSVESEARP